MIWDVRWLVGLSCQFPVKQVPLAHIAELDQCFWFPAGGDATCREVAQHAQLIAATDLAHPIILAPDGRVMDGMHRVCRHCWNHATIAAVQFEILPEPDHTDVDVETLSYEEPW